MIINYIVGWHIYLLVVTLVCFCFCKYKLYRLSAVDGNEEVQEKRKPYNFYLAFIELLLLLIVGSSVVNAGLWFLIKSIVSDPVSVGSIMYMLGVILFILTIVLLVLFTVFSNVIKSKFGKIPARRVVLFLILPMIAYIFVVTGILLQVTV